MLRCAYEAVRANQGAPGVDGMSFWRIEHDAEGVDGFLGNILRELKDKTYMASPVKRTYIEKANGKEDSCRRLSADWKAASGSW